MVTACLARCQHNSSNCVARPEIGFARQAQEGPLLPLERLDAIQDVIAGTNGVSAVLEAALVRLEKLAREMGGLLA